MREYAIGVKFGRGVATLLPNAYVQGSYAFVIPEEVRGIRPYRSQLGWDVGYFAAHRLAVRTLGELQIGHAGLKLFNDFQIRVPSNQNWVHHDQTTRVSYLNLGGGASFSVTKSWRAFLALTTTVWGRNGHALSLGEVVDVSWRFRAPWAKQVSSDNTDPKLPGAAQGAAHKH